MKADEKKRFLVRALDDDAVLLDAMAFTLETEGWRVRTWTDPKKFFSELEPDVPGCFVLDARMPELSGLEVQERLNAAGLRHPVIFLTGHGDLDMAVHVFRHGAFDFLQKPINPDEFLACIERAVKKDEEGEDNKSPESLYGLLTDREKAVVKGVALYLTSREIADQLGCSERTVEGHRARALKKLGLKRPDDVAEFLKKLKN